MTTSGGMAPMRRNSNQSSPEETSTSKNNMAPIKRKPGRPRKVKETFKRPSGPTKVTSIRMDEELHTAAKVWAARNDMSFGDLFHIAIAEKIGKKWPK
ncbi:hypothetical protein [Trueperella pyogenes]